MAKQNIYLFKLWETNLIQCHITGNCCQLHELLEQYHRYESVNYLAKSATNGSGSKGGVVILGDPGQEVPPPNLIIPSTMTICGLLVIKTNNGTFCNIIDAVIDTFQCYAALTGFSVIIAPIRLF